MTPKLPDSTSLTGRALALMLKGHRITHRDFQNHAASYRLSHDVWILRCSGWPIEDHWEQAMTSDKTKRSARFKRYFLTNDDLGKLRLNFGERLKNFVQAVDDYEAEAANAAASVGNVA